MTFRQFTLLILAAASFSMLVACGSSSHPIAVTFAATPPTSVTAGSQTAITANVANDGKNLGVSWSVSCANSGQCGTFSSATTASGTPVTYTAPVSMPSGGVTITATSVTDSSKFIATGAITISGAAGLVDGNYAYQLTGQDADGNLFNAAGVFTVTGGVIAAGEQDFVDVGGATGVDTINPATSTIAGTSDGNLTINIDTGDPTIGVSGVETLNVAPLTASGGLIASGLINEFDAWAAATGQLVPQDTTAAAAIPAEGYAFSVTGTDHTGCATVFGGIINVDVPPGGIDGTGSIFDVNDCFSPVPAVAVANTSFVSTPDALGRVQFTIDSVGPELIWAGYIVDSTSIYLVETADTFLGTTGGTAYSQGANTGTFSDTSTSIAGVTYGFGSIGTDSVGLMNYGGSISFNTDGSISGSATFVDGPNIINGPLAAATPAYAVDTTGRVTVTGLSVTDASGAPTWAFTQYQYYLDGNGNAGSASMDTTDVIGGSSFAETSGASLSGASGLTVLGVASLGYYAAVGQIVSSSSSVSGFTDYNYLFFPEQTADVALTGTVASGVATVTGVNADTPANSNNFTIYTIDSNRSFAIAGDGVQLGVAFSEFQN